MTIPFQTRDYRDTINEYPEEQPMVMIPCEKCEIEYLEGEYTRCPGCNPE